MIFFPPQFAAHGYEGHRDDCFPRKLPTFTLPHLQILQAAFPDRDDQPPAFGELVQQRLGRARRGCRNEDGLVRRRFRPTHGTIAQVNGYICISQVFQGAGGPTRQGRMPLDGVDGSGQAGWGPRSRADGLRARTGIALR